MTRQVTPAEFAEIECSRCGDCCEAFWLASPLELAQHLGELHYVAIDDRWAEWYSGSGDRDGAARMERWLMHIAPVDEAVVPRWGERMRYSCDRFVRDDANHGTCTAYDDRPHACSAFPYGNPQPAFERCTWNVELIDPDAIV